MLLKLRISTININIGIAEKNLLTCINSTPTFLLRLYSYNKRTVTKILLFFAQGRGGGVTQFVHGRSRMTIDPRIHTMPG